VRRKEGAGYKVFFDFDNTITTIDVIDDMLERFSKDDHWVGLEERWRNGEIGSKECLKGQMAGVRIRKKALDAYLKTVGIDPYFKRLIKLLRLKNIGVIILSDDFDYIIGAILRNHGVRGLKVCSNTLRIAGNRLKARFTLTNRACNKCGHCKKASLLANVGKDMTSVYIGDGLSDADAASHADIVFAKKVLHRQLEERSKKSVHFERLSEVYRYFKRRMT